MITPITTHTKEQHAKSLADYLPGGPLFAAKNMQGANFHNLIRGLACELQNAEAFLKVAQDEFIPDQTVVFIDEWESAVGIPDCCFSGTGDIVIRRRDVLIKLASLGIQTNQDFVDLAALFGIVVTIITGTTSGLFPMVFPIVFYDSPQAARFTIVVTFTVPESNRFPLVFPFTFGDDSILILECLFTKLKPANCDIVFNQV